MLLLLLLVLLSSWPRAATSLSRRPRWRASSRSSRFVVARAPNTEPQWPNRWRLGKSNNWALGHLGHAWLTQRWVQQFDGWNTSVVEQARVVDLKPERVGGRRQQRIRCFKSVNDAMGPRAPDKGALSLAARKRESGGASSRRGGTHVPHGIYLRGDQNTHKTSAYTNT